LSLSRAAFTGNATATNLTVYSPGNFSGDSVGEAKILSGQTSVRITFSQAYQYQPIRNYHTRRKPSGSIFKHQQCGQFGIHNSNSDNRYF
jgi:hypothetical protein